MGCYILEYAQAVKEYDGENYGANPAQREDYNRHEATICGVVVRQLALYDCSIENPSYEDAGCQTSEREHNIRRYEVQKVEECKTKDCIVAEHRG